MPRMPWWWTLQSQSSEIRTSTSSGDLRMPSVAMEVLERAWSVGTVEQFLDVQNC